MEKPNYRKLLVWQKAHRNAISIIDSLSAPVSFPIVEKENLEVIKILAKIISNLDR